MPDVLIGILAAVAGIVIGAVAVLSFRAPGWSPGFKDAADDAPQQTESKEIAGLLAALPQAHIMTDRSGVVTRASTQAYSIGLVRGERITRSEVVRLVERALDTGELQDGILTIRRSSLKNTGTLTLNVRATSLSGGRALVLFADHTSARKIEEMRRDFVANVSHELKTPIGAISLLAETIDDCADEPELVHKFTGQLQKESQRLGDLVQEIIQLSRLQEGDALTNPELVDIHTVIADAADRVRVEAETRNIALRVGKARPGAELFVYGDYALLTTAVRNLLDNAVRYSNAQSTVSVGASADSGFLRISVVDQGAGIPLDMRDRVFERFYRGDFARSRETGGSGLGLSIVKHVAADHGGRVELWSDEGKGSTFTLVLPQASGPGAAGRSSSSDTMNADREEVHS